MLALFADSIFRKAQALNAASITTRQKRYLNRAINFEIRHACDALLPDNLIPRVSVSADLLAQKMGVDLRLVDWHDQPKFDPGRKIFHMEHFIPVRDVRLSCCAASCAAEVLDVLKSKIVVAWILKEEDNRLNELGFRSKRPDPEAAYRAAGIKLL
ncbi:MAG: hypothetical protein ACKO5F_02005 [Synechococcus sp.]